MTDIIFDRAKATMNILKARVECTHKLTTETYPISKNLFDDLVPWISKMPTQTVDKQIVFKPGYPSFTIKFTKK
jgi:hypothetical protein